MKSALGSQPRGVIECHRFQILWRETCTTNQIAKFMGAKGFDRLVIFNFYTQWGIPL
jgi:hypothetical protein